MTCWSERGSRVVGTHERATRPEDVTISCPAIGYGRGVGRHATTYGTPDDGASSNCATLVKPVSFFQHHEPVFCMLNDSPATPRRYQDEVPAVARAVRLLVLLADAPAAQTLAELSRALGIGSSSLLAILTTLRRAGLVARDDRGSYRVGPGLAALGAAAARRAGLFERFAAIADDLVTRLGESVLLWVRHEDGFVLAAAREGTLPLRFVPVPGAWRHAHETTLGLLAQGEEIVEEELLPGVWTIAVALPSPRDGCFAALALAGPRDRLREPVMRTTLLGAMADPMASAAPSAERVPVQVTPAYGTPGAGQWELSGPIDGDELDAFLRQSLVATLSYLADDGYPATVPLWYAWDGSGVLAGAPARLGVGRARAISIRACRWRSASRRRRSDGCWCAGG